MAITELPSSLMIEPSSRIVSPLTISLVCSALFLAVFRLTNIRKRQKNEPLIVPGVPFFGSGLDFQRDAVRFFLDSAKKFGDLFTIQLPMNVLHVVMDPHSYDEFTRHRVFDFDPIQRMVNKNVFHFHLKDARKIIREAGKVARSNQLTENMVIYSRFLVESFDKRSTDIKGVLLKNFLVETQFRAIFNSIFGASDSHPFNHHDVHKQFDIFHKSFNYLWLGFPVFLFPAAHKAMKMMIAAHPTAKELLDRDDLSLYMRNALERMGTNGQTSSDVLGHNLVYLHVNYNTVKLSYWLLVNLMKHKEGYNALQREIDDFLETRSVNGEAEIDVAEIDQLPILDSVVKESFRCSSGVLMIREVVEDTDFTMRNGETYHLRKNDKVAIYPPAIHHDPEIYEKPNEFQYDRYIDAEFYKNGKVIQKPLLPFGSLCPGQKMSIAQIKLFTLSFFASYNVSPHEGSPLPQYNKNCYGHEILPPLQDELVDVTIRSQPITIQLTALQGTDDVEL